MGQLHKGGRAEQVSIPTLDCPAAVLKPRGVRIQELAGSAAGAQAVLLPGREGLVTRSHLGDNPGFLSEGLFRAARPEGAGRSGAAGCKSKCRSVKMMM